MILLGGLWRRELNPKNILSHKGRIARAYARLIRLLYCDSLSSQLTDDFRREVRKSAPIFDGVSQEDSQEFLLFFVDGLHEDLNRILDKPNYSQPDSTDEMVNNTEALAEFAETSWSNYKSRNESVICDLFTGIYKSTVVCHFCHKVSFNFDPFNTLTLELPRDNDNIWSGVCWYYPLRGRPVRVDTEVPISDSIVSLKEHVALRMGSDPQKLLMAETTGSTVFRTFDNDELSLYFVRIKDTGSLALFELSSVPTDFSTVRPSKQRWNYQHNSAPDFYSTAADRMLIPVFNRAMGESGSQEFVGRPSFIVVTREEAYDYDRILRKVLGKVANLTTRDFLSEGGLQLGQFEDEVTPDATRTEDEDGRTGANSAGSRVKAKSVDGEEMVDASVHEEPDMRQATLEDQPDYSVPSQFRNLFDMKVVEGNTTVPAGKSSIHPKRQYPSIASRISQRVSSPQEDVKEVSHRSAN